MDSDSARPVSPGIVAAVAGLSIAHPNTHVGDPQRNLSISILTMPAKILLRIFSMLVPPSIALQYYEAPSTTRFTGKRQCPCSSAHKDIISVSQVCSLLRATVLGHPPFWSPIWITNHLNSEQIALNFMQRALDNPLEIIIIDSTQHMWEYGCPRITKIQQNQHSEHESTDSEFQVSSSYLHNPMQNFWSLHKATGKFIKILHIASPISSDADEFFKQPMPFLESFALDRPLSSQMWNHDEGYNLPTPIFGGITPQLQKLMFQKVKFSWDDPIFKNLSYLSVSCVAVRDSEVSLKRLLEILSRCPDLVTFGLAVRVESPQSSLSLLPVISLPYLRNLILTQLENAVQCKTILSCLQTQVLQMLDIFHFDMPAQDIRQIIPIQFKSEDLELQKIYINWDLSTIEVQSQMASNKITSVHLRTKDNLHCKRNMCSFRYQCCNFPWDIDRTSALSKLLAPVLRQICSPEAKIIKIENNHPPMLEACHFPFTELFRHCHKMETLIIDGMFDEQCHQLKVSLHAEVQAAEDQDTVALPSLQELSLSNVDLGIGLNGIYSFLLHRHIRGCPLKVVSLIECNNIQSDILEKAVTNLEVMNYDEELDSELPASWHHFFGVFPDPEAY
ncbi:hypothetical protein SCHPADRAFT_962352 [Schizopora paradoxa]|uniref:F-box domain-containing protein n=1 Tax=Schizopora paradoxa TaxID=27342 RepID=A0A0H2SFB1_9AGAM|nr:hypothetical protein SCHPADRAFT_962352 [Schizopora paradoxa]